QSRGLDTPGVAYTRVVCHPSVRDALILLFFFNDTAAPEIYTLSLHDALPIYATEGPFIRQLLRLHVFRREEQLFGVEEQHAEERSEEHTSELQSRRDLVCRLLLEKKKR